MAKKTKIEKTPVQREIDRRHLAILRLQKEEKVLCDRQDAELAKLRKKIGEHQLIIKTLQGGRS